MASEVHDLAVKVAPEGAQETQRALDDVGGTFEETAEIADEQASRLDGFAKEWKGAMTAIVAGLGVAAAGLLSKVPVVGDVMAGLEAVIDSLALKLDETLRPVLGDVSKDLFDLASDVDDADGAVDAFIKTLVGLDEIADQFEQRTIDITADLIADVIFEIAELTTSDVTSAIDRSVDEFNFWDVVPVGFELPGRLLGGVGEEIFSRIFGEDFKQQTISFWTGWLEELQSLTVTDITNMFKTAVENALVIFSDFRVMLGEMALKAAAGIREAFTTGFQIVVNEIKKAGNKILASIEKIVNDSITALNKLPSFNLGRVSLARLQTESNQAIAERGRQRLQERTENIEGAADEARERGRERARNTFAEQQTVDLNVNPAKFKEFLNAELNSGPANQGRD